MQMDVKDFRARVGPTVQDEPVSRFVDPLFLSELGGNPDHVSVTLNTVPRGGGPAWP